MSTLRVAALFAAILTAATVVTVTMMALVVQLRSGVSSQATWWSLSVALAGAGASLAIVALVHLTLAAFRRRPSMNLAAIAVWTEAWAEVADGEPPPVVPGSEMAVASEAAAQLLRDLEGQPAEDVRIALAVTGVLRADLEVAARQGAGRMAATEAMERLAWIAPVEALPLFRRAALGPEARAAHAAILGACRVLRVLPPSEAKTAVDEIATVLAAHASALREPEAARPFLAAAITASGQRVGDLCMALIVGTGPEPVRAAAFDALGNVQPPGAGETVEGALRAGLMGETAAAALRALARIGQVTAEGAGSVVAACRSAHVGTRVQAAHALVGAPQRLALTELWRLLGDPNYEVRLASAAALARLGPAGQAELARAARAHEDAFARDIAAMTRSVPHPATTDPGLGRDLRVPARAAGL